VNQVNARMLRVLDSHTNFACLNSMRPAKEVIAHYQKNGILLGPEIPGMPNYVRVSFGAPEEMRNFGLFGTFSANTAWRCELSKSRCTLGRVLA